MNTKKTGVYLAPSINKYENTLQSASRRLHRHQLIVASVYVVVSLCVYVLTGQLPYGVICMLFLLTLLYVPFARRWIRPLWSVGQAMRALAAENDIRYIEVAKPNYSKHFQPAIARVGLWERHEQIVKGQFGKYQFETYVDTFRHPFASRFSRVATRVYCITLPKELPHIFMRNLQSGNQYLGSLTRHFDDDQRVDLEGNFQRHFTTYTHRRTVTETLSLLSPNFMETLITANQQFDVEFVGNRLYLYTSNYYPTAAQLSSAFDTIEQLLWHVDHRLKSWKFTLPNNQRFPYLISRPGYGTVLLGGKYYNRAWLAILLYTAYAALRVALEPEDRMAKLAVVVVSDLFMIVALLIYRRKYQLIRRNVAR